MKPTTYPVIVLFALALLVPTLSEARSVAKPTKRPITRPIQKERPRVEMVFALDTTGSMGGLLAGAKQKIWSIVNEVVKGQPTPEVRIGIVAYRDKGDAYVTKVTQLTNDLDAVYKDLMSLQAGGGGDGPENVNQALHDALHRIEWSGKGKRALRVIFLVGDAPPHTDYQDVPSYEVTVREAAQRGVIVNTVRCGSWVETGTHWAKIASLGGGKYLSIDQTGGMLATTTPFDDKLARLAKEMDGTYVVGGSVRTRREAKKSLKEAAAVADSGGSFAKAERALYRSKVRGAGGPAKASTSDLVAKFDLDAGSIDGTLARPALLPAAMQKMSIGERKAYIRKQSNKRKALQAEIDAVGKNRADYLAAKSPGDEDSFDSKILEVIKVQAAAEASIAY